MDFGYFKGQKKKKYCLFDLYGNELHYKILDFELNRRQCRPRSLTLGLKSPPNKAMIITSLKELRIVDKVKLDNEIYIN